MQRLGVSGAVRPLYESLGFKGLTRALVMTMLLWVAGLCSEQMRRHLLSARPERLKVCAQRRYVCYTAR